MPQYFPKDRDSQRDLADGYGNRRRGKKLELAVAVTNETVGRRPCPNCTDEQKRTFGCEEETTERNYWIKFDDGTVLKTCPYKKVKRKHYRMIQAASLIESGILPDAGGYYDQAACFTRAAALVLHYQQEARNAKRSAT